MSVTVDPPNRAPLHRAVFHTLVALGLQAGREDRVVLIRVDAVQNTAAEDLSQLLVALGDALAHRHDVTDAAGTPHQVSLPLAVYLTALPEFHDLATANAGATFGRRFAPVTLHPLADEDLRQALAPFVRDGWEVLGTDGPARVVAEAEAVDQLLAKVLGDPFLFQLAGQHAWGAGTGPVITASDVGAGWQAAIARCCRIPSPGRCRARSAESGPGSGEGRGKCFRDVSPF